jgi:hypothetical protein
MLGTQIDVSGDYLGCRKFQVFSWRLTPRIFLIAFKSFFRVSRLALFRDFRSATDNTDSIADITISGSLTSLVRRLRYFSSRASIDASEYGERRCSGVSWARARLMKEWRICARPARLRPLLLPASVFLLRCSSRSHGGIQPACFAARCRASCSHDGGLPYHLKYSASVSIGELVSAALRGRPALCARPAFRRLRSNFILQLSH